MHGNSIARLRLLAGPLALCLLLSACGGSGKAAIAPSTSTTVEPTLHLNQQPIIDALCSDTTEYDLNAVQQATVDNLVRAALGVSSGTTATCSTDLDLHSSTGEGTSWNFPTVNFSPSLAASFLELPHDASIPDPYVTTKTRVYGAPAVWSSPTPGIVVLSIRTGLVDGQDWLVRISNDSPYDTKLLQQRTVAFAQGLLPIIFP